MRKQKEPKVLVDYNTVSKGSWTNQKRLYERKT